MGSTEPSFSTFKKNVKKQEEKKYVFSKNRQIQRFPITIFFFWGPKMAILKNVTWPQGPCFRPQGPKTPDSGRSQKVLNPIKYP